MPNSTNRIAQRRAAAQVQENLEEAKALQLHPGKAADGKFLPGHEYALKYPLEVAQSLFRQMYDRLIENESTGEPDDRNPVRANTIKLVKELCLCVGISHKTYQRLKRIYTARTDMAGNKNVKYSEAIFSLSEKIEEICESRLAYSGQFMDIFILKNHYGYVDKQEISHTLNETPQTVFTLPDGTKIPI